MIPIAAPQIGEREQERVNDVLENGQLADGAEVRAFEEALANRYDRAHGIATSNGTTALHAALVGLGIGPGDTVVTTPFSFIATANAIRLVGADIAFVDIRPDTLTMSPDALEKRLQSGKPVDAVLPVHLFGLPADMAAIRALQDNFGFAIIEDAAQAHDARVDGAPVGSLGDVACFSFYPTKNMTTGEGGIILTDSRLIAERTRRFIDHGRSSGYDHVDVGHNFRLSSVHAAIGNVQLTRLEKFTEARRRTAATFSEQLADVPVTLPVEPAGRKHVYHQYTIRHGDRDRLRAMLRADGIQTGVYYPTPIHRQPVYDGQFGRFPVAEEAAERVLSLPVHPGVTAAEADHVVDRITAALGAIA